MTYSDFVANLGDAELEAYEDSQHAWWDHYMGTGDRFSADFLHVRMEAVVAEKTRRVEARSRHADDPRTPTWTEGKQIEYERLRDLAEYLRQQWPIERFMIELMAVDLTQAGPNRMKGCCPFHPDETPSMTVYTDQGTFFCFGCSEFGDVFDCVGYYFALDSYRDRIDKLAGATPNIPERFTADRRQRLKQGGKRRKGVRILNGEVVAA